MASDYKPLVPPGWEVRLDTQGRMYFYDQITGKSTLRDPALPLFPPTASIPPTATGFDSFSAAFPSTRGGVNLPPASVPQQVPQAYEMAPQPPAYDAGGLGLGFSGYPVGYTPPPAVSFSEPFPGAFASTVGAPLPENNYAPQQQSFGGPANFGLSINQTQQPQKQLTPYDQKWIMRTSQMLGVDPSMGLSSALTSTGNGQQASPRKSSGISRSRSAVTQSTLTGVPSTTNPPQTPYSAGLSNSQRQTMNIRYPVPAARDADWVPDSPTRRRFRPYTGHGLDARISTWA